MNYFFLFWYCGIAEELGNKLKGLWEVIPITNSLPEFTDFVPIYIDDTVDELESTMDLFILKPANNIEWLSDIRGTSVTTKPNKISNSGWSIVKISYFDEDPYPDILISTPVLFIQDNRSIRLLRNKVRENIETIKKESLNRDYSENYEKLEDWPKFDLFTVEKSSVIIDFLVHDINHDGVPDIILAIKHKDGSCSIQELLFLNTETLAYQVE